MEQPSKCTVRTNRDKRWPYIQYYYGEKDQSEQRNGMGENHWSGPESLESYTGTFLHDMMHGEGDYRWRYKDPDGAFVTYEGQFYANKLHGYGVMSYPDGKVFTGLYYNNVRWGPGIERTPDLKSNVGLWRGTKLARLTWMPDGRPVAPDFTKGPAGPTFLDPFRRILTAEITIMDAIKRTKNAGCDPLLAEEFWPRMYCSPCSEPTSVLFHKNLFDLKYYKDIIYSLSELSDDSTEEPTLNLRNRVADYFAWNNSEMMVHMMKHSFQHDKQRFKVKLNLSHVLNGPRSRFRPAGKYEVNCRTVLLASFLGNIKNVAQLVNEEDVYADIADMRGNTALMYAVCGDKRNIINFLVEAGADVNCYNDSCCTPLGVALVRYLGVLHDITADRFPLAFLPPLEQPAKIPDKDAEVQEKKMEWNIFRDLSPKVSPGTANSTNKLKGSVTKINALVKSSPSTLSNNKSESTWKTRNLETNYDSDDGIFTEEKTLFFLTKTQYYRKVSEIDSRIPNNIETEYLFSVNDYNTFMKSSTRIVKELAMTKKGTEKSHQILFENRSVDVASLDSTEKQKHDMVTEIELTIMDLLALGADPKLVVCPQPALLLACKTKKPNIMIQMVSHGVDVNQQFPGLMNYTVLDIVATDEEITLENLTMMETLLKLGADTQHRIPLPINLDTSSSSISVGEMSGPTLLHAVVMKKPILQCEEDVIERMVQQLLSYNCDPSAQYKGSSAINAVMMNDYHLFTTFIKHPSTNLNAIINSKNQTILVKLFTKEYIYAMAPQYDLVPMLTNLLLYGADPLIKCYNENNTYENVFHFATRTYQTLQTPTGTKRNDKKDVMPNKKKGIADVTVSTIIPKSGEVAVLMQYKELLDIMTECARLLHVRWIQGKLARELIEIINKFSHRPWSTIIKEIENGYVLGSWLNAQRCLEIWDILKATKKKKYTNPKTLMKFVSIIHFYATRVHSRVNTKKQLMAAESNNIDADVKFLLKEHKITSSLSQEAEAMKMKYVQPELDVYGENKFHVCYECSLQPQEFHLTCDFCGLVFFCNIDCLKENIGRFESNHPCDTLLAEKYLPPLEDNSVLLFKDVEG